jgi:hypothetical protein
MMTRWAPRMWVSLVVLGIFVGTLPALSDAQDMAATGVTVATWQYNTHRTGLNPNEGVLLYNNLTTSNFGQL